MNAPNQASARQAEVPVKISTDAYTSVDYARLEADRLWPKVWQVACRIEELEIVGDYSTYDILDESIILVRTGEAAHEIAAYHNQCQHRGRRLVEGEGRTKRFVCPFHSWTWSIDGENIAVTRGDAWDGALDTCNIALKKVHVGFWGGWVFINMDLHALPLEEYLAPVPAMLDCFEFENMRYRWRQWLKFPCNWKVAIEAFNEGYHVAGTHPQLTKFSPKPTWSGAWGKHGVFGSAAAEGSGGASAGASGAADMRVGLAHSLNQLWEEVNATTTQTMVDIANNLVNELPEGTPAGEVQMHLMRRSVEEDAKRGVVWPEIDPSHFSQVGNVVHVFPNTVVIHGPVFALCYRARPDGDNPDSCIFEVYTLEKYPEGQEPKPENVYAPEMTEEKWRKVLCQDFSNMEAVQKGLKSKHFSHMLPSPVEEIAIMNFHRTLAEYTGQGAPEPLL